MKPTSWNFIVISAHGPVLEKIGLSFKAALILVAAFVVAFLMTVLLLLMFPNMRVNEPDRLRLAAENQFLKTENKNLELKLHKLDTQMSHVQEHSAHVVALMQTD
jgi:competence protein ComGC